MMTTLALIIGLQAIDLPPSRYQDNVVTAIEFGTVVMRCGHLAGPGQRVLSCASTKPTKVMVVPHPCQSSGEYAKIVCHELGHVNGWPADHPR